jgi:hypothetical protein
MHTSFRKSVKIDAVPNLHMGRFAASIYSLQDCTCAGSEHLCTRSEIAHVQLRNGIDFHRVSEAGLFRACSGS